MCCSSLFRECRGRFFPPIRCKAMLRLVQRLWRTLANQIRGFAISANHVPNPIQCWSCLLHISRAFHWPLSCPTLSSDFRRFCVLGLVYFARDFPELSYSSNKWKIRFRSKDCISLGTSNFLPRTFLETIKKQTANSWKSAVQNIKAFVI